FAHAPLAGRSGRRAPHKWGDESWFAHAPLAGRSGRRSPHKWGDKSRYGGTDMKPTILAFETSCDETSVAVVRGLEVLSNVISSQVEIHARFGGVVPEVAARAHVESIRTLTH